MTPQRWTRIKEIFEAALEIDSSQRSSFLHRACAGDEQMRLEVASLLAAHADASNLLPTDRQPPLLGEPQYSAGTLLGGRFRILRFLGRGGMGEVYAAWDEDVRQNVAIKTLVPQISRDQVAISRLRSEIQNARKVTHPNVCRVFDLVRDAKPDQDYFLLTMELVEGETLAALLKRDGPLPIAAALHVARQLANALDAAHIVGVIHRDFKTGNILLDQAGGGPIRAVVTDFGLARDVLAGTPGGETLTASGLLVGTPAYMAPELLNGALAGTASDIYSFGIVVHEIVTGGRPHPGSTVRLPAAYGKPWVAAIQRCIDPDPQQRFHSAGQAVAAIEGRSRREWFLLPGLRSMIVAGVIALLLLAAASALRFGKRGAPPQAGAEILLADVKNVTTDAELDASTELFRSELQQSAQFRLWDRRHLSTVFQRMKQADGTKLAGSVAREVAYREGVPLIVSSSITPVGDEISVDVLLEQLESGSPNVRTRWSKGFRAAGKSDIGGAVREACVWLRRTLGERPETIAAHDRPPEDVTTHDWRALAAYAQAERFQAERQSDSAVQILNAAVLFDPHFALAYMRLGDILTANRQQADGLRYWRQAIAEADHGRLTRYEELRLRGLYSGDTWDWPAYEAAFAEMEKEFPYDWLASFYLGDALGHRGRGRDSLAAFLRASGKTKNSVPLADNLGSTYLILGDYGAVDREEAELSKLGAGAQARLLSGRSLFARADFSGALQTLRGIEASADGLTFSRARWLEAAALAEMGMNAEAERTLRESGREDEIAGLPDAHAEKLAGLAYLRMQADDLAAAREFIRLAAATARSPYQLVPIGVLAARLREVELSQNIVARIAVAAPDSVLAQNGTLVITGELQLARGSVQDALNDLEKWDRLESARRPRTSLARALERAGRLGDAVVLYARDSDIARLSRFGSGAEAIYPGFFTDTLLDLGRAAERAGDRIQAKGALQEYLKRRATAGLDTSGTQMARILLKRISAKEN
jgi:hypothetical protein